MKRDINAITSLLSDFMNSMERRSTIFLVGFEEVFSKILKWDLAVWKFRWQNLKGNEKRIEGMDWFELSHILGSIISRIGERVIKERQGFFSMFFLKHFQKHVEAHKEEQILVNNRRIYYVEHLFRIFCQLVFEKVSSSDESYDFWKAFPSEWKVTKDNLVGEKSLIPKILLHEFLAWTRQRIWSNVSSDPQLNDVSTNLFPEVKPMIWAIVLIFVFSPFDPENRVKSVIERPWSFGYSFKPIVSFGEKEIKEAIEAQKVQEKLEIQNAYEMTRLLFPEIFTEELLKTYINQVNELKYAEESTENSRQAKMLDVFLGLLESLKKE